MQARRPKLVLSKHANVDQTLENYQSFLRAYFDDDTIDITILDNGIKMELSRKTFETSALQDLVPPAQREEHADQQEISLYFRTKYALLESTPYTILKAKADELHRKINNPAAALPRALRQLISRLEEEAVREGNYYQYLCITDFCLNVCDQLLEKPNLSVEEIKHLTQDLDEKLLGKPPISRYLKAALFGFIGAVVGLALGVVIAGGSTIWAGGFGAIPGAIAGAFKGAALGTTLATISSAGLIGAISGLFSSRNAHNNYFQNVQEVAELHKPYIKAASSLAIAALDPEKIDPVKKEEDFQALRKRIRAH
ncbi:MAG: hypothetical protein P4M14_07515 [Gammaproteobacteria bacterium]|nr:hypothetical protein [Gammaproteobacteria bacterium]